MNLYNAATNTLEILENVATEQGHVIRAQRSVDDPTIHCHLKWMLIGIREGYVAKEKGHRWLGFVQGVLAHRYEVPLRELMEANKPPPGDE